MAARSEGDDMVRSVRFRTTSQKLVFDDTVVAGKAESGGESIYQ